MPMFRHKINTDAEWSVAFDLGASGKMSSAVYAITGAAKDDLLAATAAGSSREDREMAVMALARGAQMAAQKGKGGGLTAEQVKEWNDGRLKYEAAQYYKIAVDDAFGLYFEVREDMLKVEKARQEKLKQ